MNKYQIQSQANITALTYSKKYQKRLGVLQKLIREFSENQVSWAVACSFALFLLGIVDNFHDYDLLVAPESFETVCSILERIGKRKNYDKDPSRNGCFSSKFFAEFEVDDIDIDVICEFGFTTFDSYYQYHFTKSDIQYVEFNGKKLPVVPSEAQYIFYSMMAGWQKQRTFKRDLIGAYLKAGHLHLPHIFKNALENEDLPDFLVKGIHELLNL